MSLGKTTSASIAILTYMLGQVKEKELIGLGFRLIS
jgi:hypothetical protein